MQILQQIGDQERNIVALQQAIHNKEAPLRVAQSRLRLRSLRPNMELCRDQPQLRCTHAHTFTHTVSSYYITLPPFSCFISLASFVCSLEEEVRQIDATLASLNQQLNEARGSLSQLEESRITLEKDINCKTNSLFVEREKCMAHRKRYPTISTLSGF